MADAQRIEQALEVAKAQAAGMLAGLAEAGAPPLAILRAGLGAVIAASPTLPPGHRCNPEQALVACEDVFDTVLRTLMAGAVVYAGADGIMPTFAEAELAATGMLMRAYTRLRRALPQDECRVVLAKAMHSIIGQQAQLEPGTPAHAPCDAMRAVEDRMHDLMRGKETGTFVPRERGS